MSSTTEQSISSSRVKTLLNDLVNKDVNEKLADLGEKLKTYRQYLIHLKTGKVAVLDSEGDKVYDEIPVLDENGVQVTKMVRDKEDKKKKHEELVVKKKVRHVELSAEEIKKREDYVNDFKLHKLGDLTKKVSAYKKYKVKFSKDAIVLLVTFVEKLSVAWLNIAADFALHASKDLKESAKIKIRLMHLLKSNFASLPGIKAYFGNAFFEIMGLVHEEEITSAVKSAASLEKKRLKEAGYTKGTAAREKAAKQRKNEALKKIQEEAEKYKGLSNEEIAKIKTEELLNGVSKKKKTKESDNAKANKEKIEVVFVNAIKKNFKLARGKKYSVAGEVIKFFEKACFEFLNHVGGVALAELEVNGNGTFDGDLMHVFLTGISSSDISVSRKFTLNDIEVPSEAALKVKRAERKALLEQQKYAAPIDLAEIPKEASYEAVAETTFGGNFSSAYGCLLSTKTVLEEEAKKKAEERKAKEDLKKSSHTTEEKPEKKVSKKQQKKVESDSESDSDSEDEQPVQVTKKSTKTK